MTARFFPRKLAASAVMASLALPLTFGIAQAQESAPFNPTEDNQLGSTADVNRTTIQSLIDSNRSTADLTIHKFKGAETTEQADGTEKDTNNLGEPLEATFNVQRIGNLDPKKIEDWQAYAALDTSGYNAGDATLGGENLGPVTAMTTTDGVASQEFEMGFYVVTEVPKPGRTTVAPFLVALPMTNPNNAEWNYDVHVYPKNQEFGITKTVADAYAKVGDTITYTLTGDMVAPNTGQDSYSRYVMVDRQPENITLNTSNVEVTVGNTQLAAGDFTVTPGGVDGDQKIALTESGLAKAFAAKQADASAQVKATITATVEAMTVGDTVNVQENVAFLYVDNSPGNPDNPNPGDPDNPGDPSSRVESRFGKVTLNKIGSDTNSALAGAQFQLYRCAEGSTESDEPTTIDGPLTVNGQDTWTTGEDGTILIEGLQVDDFRDGATAEDTFDYCFVEVKSPEGYELLPDPVAFEVKNEAAAPVVDITNIPDNGGNDLPFTGENGIFWMLGLAGLLAAGGAAMFLTTRKEA